ncbi:MULTISPECIES: GreA/GreB family elongation factor [unclassified Leeuwenhoekiella]|uniref:GreA/GreB family elongation factor n=1 Tax=unclassified Leeuwenhoekiella TaxID=2615029 RepID=UPI000C61CF36|nr:MULTISPECIES: GreA/GreB family elongation factor [unclassified Leeuwenhoekiella]MAW94165.1 transcription elongation factor GreA [Leeuwenhoekiella sp.]MAW96219.1 transcription elongation factor GreA [Leeuwenhoekiella sp.]MBA80213.1 transcription elongation factor GreA [Leeuwenhoekiella sp.]|tara:strand:+ start:2024 stop:2524 length:501 start_codon:yes stop_codon:yes gene_type:complete
MSRGFVKEDDQEETPIIPPRAALPDEAINYVTENGLALLKTEKEELSNEIANLTESDERERRRALAVLNGKLNLLQERLASARLLDTVENKNEVRFGAAVVYEIDGKSKQRIQIVGVDEADIKKRKIAFTAPIAQALMGKEVGEIAELRLGSADLRELKVLEISYS